jgi:enolase
MFVKEVVPSFVKNSRGERSIRVEVITYAGKFRASAPSGKSKGKSEVASYNRDGIDQSMKILRLFCKKLKNENFMIKKVDDLKTLVGMMKRFETRHGKFGGNVFYAVEAAFLKAASADSGRELWEFINDDVNSGLRPKMPMPVGNCIGGGLHSKISEGKRPDFQEFLLIPKEKSYARAVTLNLRAYEYAKKLLRKTQKKWRLKRNDEGAWMTNLTNEDVLEVLKRVAKKYEIRIGLDIASSSFYKNGYYHYKNKELIRDKIDQADYIERLVKKFGIFYVEDGMQEEDFGGFKEILNAVEKKKKSKTLIVGDDLTTTNLRLVRRAVMGKAINAMIIKPNQIGSILEVKRVVEFCKRHDIVMIFSHRSGETMDDTLADYCVGFGGHFMKAGIYGPERLIKMKRVMDIERSLE